VAKRKRARNHIALSEWVERLWLPVVRSQLKESTFDSYRRNMTNHVWPRLGDMALDEITPRMLTMMYVELLESGRRNGDHRGLSPKTVRYIHTIVHKALADAVDDGVLATNPAERAKAPKPGRSTQQHLRFWEPPQLRRFLSHVRGDDLEALWHLAALTGMRRGELLGLRWCDVDLAHGRISVCRSIVSVAYRFVETTPKSHHARVVDIDPRTVSVLETHRTRQEVASRIPLQGSDLVFTTSGNRALHPDFVTARFRLLVRELDSPGYGSTTYDTPMQRSRSAPAYPQRSSPNGSGTTLPSSR
jgi:integrase